MGQHEDTALLARLETGVRLKGGLTPYLAAGSLSLRQGGFTESARFIDVGSRFDHQVGQWTLGGTLSARRLFGNDSGFSAAFAGAEVARFTVNGQPLARATVRFGSDVSYHTLSPRAGCRPGPRARTNTWGEAAVKFGF